VSDTVRVAARPLLLHRVVLVLAGLISLLIGGAFGLLGGGGATLTLPLLLYGMHLAPRDAIAGSLAIVCATSAVGALVHARAGRVDGRVAVLFGGCSLLAAYAGGRVAALVPTGVLIAAFALMMLGSAWRMMAGTTTAPARPSATALAIAAVLVGVVSGMVGAGGGFLIVPALTLYGGVSMHRAVATSLAIIAVQSAAGLAGHLAHAQLDASLLLMMTGPAAVGAAVGAWLVPRLSPCALRRGFGVLMVAVSALFFERQVPGWGHWAVPAVIAVGGLALWWRTRPPTVVLA
jgi:uncharacterized membrane protein YfcA